MHTLQVVAVSAPSLELARDHVQGYLADRPDVTDWFSFGGRFDGALHGATVLDGCDERFVRVLDEVEARQQQRWDLLRQCVTGPDISAPVPWAPSGVSPVGDTAGQVAALLLDRQVPALSAASTRAGLAFQQLASFLFDDHTTDSVFYDMTGCTARPSAVRARHRVCPDGEFLFAMDLHS